MKNKNIVVVVYLELGKRAWVELEGPVTTEVYEGGKFPILNFKKGNKVLMAIPATSLVSAVTVPDRAKLKLVG